MLDEQESMKPCFITVEGIEGAGKTTSLAFIEQYLIQLGKQVLVTREPGGTPVAEQIRRLLLNHRQQGMTAEAETLLMFAARAEHLAHVIRPALAAGKWVVSDRFTEASYAYQGGGRGIPEARISFLEDWLQDDMRPDLTLLLDVPVRIGLERATRRNNKLDRFESEAAAFFERVKEAYLQQARLHPKRYRIIDALQDTEAVQAQIRHNLESFVS